MRCNYCGFENPSTNAICEKCKQPLDETNIPVAQSKGEPVRYEAVEQLTQRKQNGEFNPKKTVREREKRSAEISDIINCPQCGYPVDIYAETCPDCGSFISQGNNSDNHREWSKTIRPVLKKGHKEQKAGKGSFSLTLIPDENDNTFPVVLTFTEVEEVVLNRQNTEKENATITAGKQALVKYHNEKWSIVDQSDMCTTFVQAKREIELEDGDLIIMGDRLFRFTIGNEKNDSV